MKQTATVKQVTSSVIASGEVMPGTYLIWLDSPQIAPVSQPGQFVMVRCGEGTLLRRPISIHRLADGSKLALLFDVVGKGTQWLSQRKAGDSLDLLGPMGNGYTILPSSRNLLLLAGGIGIAPLTFLAQRAISQGCSVKLLMGAVTASQLCPRGLIPLEADLVCATDDGTFGKKGFITDLLPDSIDWADQVFACGPAPMYHTLVAQYQQLLGIKPAQISLEMRMGCGIGICYSCTIITQSGLKQVCKDGPVFELNGILWDELSP